MRLDTPEGNLAPSRRAIAASFFTAGYALSLSPPAAAAITTSAEGLVIEEPTFPGANAYQLPAFLARPATPGRHPAIIVVNEVFGIHEYIKDICRRLAHAGYVALAPDYFDRAGDPAQISDFNQIRPIIAATHYEQVMGDTEGALRYLEHNAHVDAHKLAITGFCWGGNVVWMAAGRFPQLKAAVAWYGRLTPPAQGDFGYEVGRPWPIDIAGSLRAPVLGLYGGQDQGITPASVEQMRAALAAAHDHTHSELVVYPDAGHGFHADYRDSYNEADAQDGWRRMLAWFTAHGV
ncbi:MAG TPA: dienelactone hydrolase family protein [Caulobacterales bacterium]|nr:dienelactone hydrolase family protein [Caulobacterales bacterium]